MKNSKFKKILIVLAITLLLVTTVFITSKNRPGPVQSAIQEYIESDCPEISQCVVRIADLTDFEWDEMHYLGGGDIAPNAIPVQLPEKHSFINNKFVFISNGELAVYEEVRMEFEYTPDRAVIINAKDSTKFIPATAKFTVEVRQSTDKDNYYLLIPVEQP